MTPGTAKSKGGDHCCSCIIIILGPKGQDKAAQTGVHVQAHIVADGQRPQPRNIVDDALRVARCRGKQEDRVGSNVGSDGRCRQLKVGVVATAVHLDEFDSVDIAGLADGRVRRAPRDKFGMRHVPSVVAHGRAHGQQNGFRPARGDAAVGDLDFGCGCGGGWWCRCIW